MADQCVVAVSFGGPFVVRHAKTCTEDYCVASFQAEQMNRRIDRAKAEK